MNKAVEDKRGDFHNAFWDAYMTLPENVRKRFSLNTGRNFANEIFNRYEEIDENKKTN